MGGIDVRTVTFESEIVKLKAFTITDRQNVKVVGISKATTFEDITELLCVLRNHRIGFAFYDPYYPSPSDPGAYLDYSQEKNETRNSWSMTLGNHGWTGGIYTISENNIALQIHHLVENGQINSISINNVKIFSHYEKQNSVRNRDQNALIHRIHSAKDKINTDDMY
ncbi:MAG: hypothetical protein EAS52_16800 [Parapedobacter sp.]|nr:MAG: hypothetical protein EAS52_16800 [Parapedobacter sp.]